MAKSVRVVELFAGVGGFRLGLEQSSSSFQTVWANQWEPSRVTQHAYDCYTAHFGESKIHVNKDIAEAKHAIPSHDLLVGGFPCQDYSVAHSGAKGIQGKKGVLWWEIHDIIKNKAPEYVLLENVDRLLRSPGAQRGRDFGVMLRCFYENGYDVEWRVINAAEYGHAQRRRRVFIFAYRPSSAVGKHFEAVYGKDRRLPEASVFLEQSFFSRNFPVIADPRRDTSRGSLTQAHYKDLKEVSDTFALHFYNAGIVRQGEIYSVRTQAVERPAIPLGEILHKEPVDKRYFISRKNREQWEYLKGSKREPRTKPNGEIYFYSEGQMAFPDSLERPARTILTSESNVNRSTHVVEDVVSGKLRLLTPVECERLNGFPEDWTNTGMPHGFRYFVMGNALVVPLVKTMGDTLLELL